MVRAAKWVMGLALLLASAGSAQAGMLFTGDYDATNWIGSGQGILDTTGAPASVSLTSNDDGSLLPGELLFEITVLANDLISFHWEYDTDDGDGAEYDPFGYVLNGNFFQLTDDSDPDLQSGDFSVAVTGGDLFGFSQRSLDSIAGAATTIISQGPTSAVPEPGSMTLVGLGAFGLVAGAIRRRRASKSSSEPRTK